MHSALCKLQKVLGSPGPRVEKGALVLWLFLQRHWPDDRMSCAELPPGPLVRSISFNSDPPTLWEERLVPLQGDSIHVPSPPPRQVTNERGLGDVWWAGGTQTRESPKSAVQEADPRPPVSPDTFLGPDVLCWLRTHCPGAAGRAT